MDWKLRFYFTRNHPWRRSLRPLISTPLRSDLIVTVGGKIFRDDVAVQECGQNTPVFLIFPTIFWISAIFRNFWFWVSAHQHLYKPLSNILRNIFVVSEQEILKETTPCQTSSLFWNTNLPMNRSQKGAGHCVTAHQTVTLKDSKTWSKNSSSAYGKTKMMNLWRITWA